MFTEKKDRANELNGYISSETVSFRKYGNVRLNLEVTPELEPEVIELYLVNNDSISKLQLILQHSSHNGKLLLQFQLSNSTFQKDLPNKESLHFKILSCTLILGVVTFILISVTALSFFSNL